MFGIFYVGNMIQQMVTSTSAFEVYFNNALIFSKLQSGGFPDPQQIENTLVGFFK